MRVTCGSRGQQYPKGCTKVSTHWWDPTDNLTANWQLIFATPCYGIRAPIQFSMLSSFGFSGGSAWWLRPSLHYQSSVHTSFRVADLEWAPSQLHCKYRSLQNTVEHWNTHIQFPKTTCVSVLGISEVIPAWHAGSKEHSSLTCRVPVHSTYGRYMQSSTKKFQGNIQNHSSRFWNKYRPTMMHAKRHHNSAPWIGLEGRQIWMDMAHISNAANKKINCFKRPFDAFSIADVQLNLSLIIIVPITYLHTSKAVYQRHSQGN